MAAALDGGQSAPSQKKSGRGWTNKAQVQDGITSTNDTDDPSHSKSGRWVKGIQGSGWLGPVTQPSSVAQEVAGRP